jgi:hypothetical protein
MPSVVILLFSALGTNDSVQSYDSAYAEQKIVNTAYIVMDVIAGLFGMMLLFNIFLLVKTTHLHRSHRKSWRRTCINTKSLTLVISSIGIVLRILSLTVKNALPASVNPSFWSNTTQPTSQTTTADDCIATWMSCCDTPGKCIEQSTSQPNCCDGCTCVAQDEWWASCTPGEGHIECGTKTVSEYFEPASTGGQLWLLYPTAQLFFIIGFLLLFQFW